MSDRLREAGVIVGHLSRALLDGSRDLRTVPDLVKRIIKEDMWQEWADPASGRRFGPFRSFEHFVLAPAAKGGLGSSVTQLRGLCEKDIEARNAIDEATQRPIGINQHSEGFNNVQALAPVGNSEPAALRRLRKDRPDLHADVLAERLSAHAAMVEAGFRPKTATITVTRPEAVARSLLKYMSADDIAKLITILLGKNGD